VASTLTAVTCLLVDASVAHRCVYYADSPHLIITIIKTTKLSVTVTVTVGVVDVSASQEQTLSGRGACLHMHMCP